VSGASALKAREYSATLSPGSPVLRPTRDSTSQPAAASTLKIRKIDMKTPGRAE
jgi:hypothetical protein